MDDTSHNGAMKALCVGVILFFTIGGTVLPASAQSWTERIKISGDYRTRQEGFYNQGNNTGSRNRTRIRGRLGLAATVNRYASVSLRLATGNPDDPISTNDTLDDFFNHPSFNIDRAFVKLRYGPSGTPVTLGVDIGKFGNPAYKTSQLLWDDDLNPNGIVERLRVKGGGRMKQFDLTLMQYTVDEVKNGRDAWMFGAQAKAGFTPGENVGFALGVGDYKYFQANVLARSKNGGIRKGNALDAAGDFRSDFNLFNLTGDVTIKTAAASYPVKLFGDFVINTRAGKDAAGNDRDTGVYAGVRIGRGSRPGEVKLTGTYLRVQQEAVLSTFSFSDVPADGRTGGIVSLGIPVLPGTAINLTGIFTRKIDPPAGVSNATLVRTQADLVVKF